MELERNTIMDEFKILMFYQTVIDMSPKEFKSDRFHWDPFDGLGDCVISADPWDWTEGGDKDD